MRKLLDILLIPLALFLIVLAISIAFGVFLFATAIIAEFLKATTNWIGSDLWKTLAAMLNDPWKLLALPISMGVMVVFIHNLLSNSSSPQRSVIRGRQLGQSRGQQSLGRPADSTRIPPSRRTPSSSNNKVPKRSGR